ncbi:MAG: Fic family protein [Chitinispirillia bacterium]|nr:Fic family protein [Chitinispirillia bacterium]MCL2268966.1 Fic family protein [Chitinispirillia bacterium]
MDIYEKTDKYKAALDAVRPFEEPALRQLRDYYRVGLTWSSNALEGNTLTEMETKVVLEDGLTIGGKPLRDIHEAIGHGKAYDYVFSVFKSGTITIDNIKAVHRHFYLAIDEENAGRWRRESVIVSGTDFAFPTQDELDGLMDGLIAWINTARSTLHPLKFAALLHLKFVTIHPFIDGNGRVARLLMCLALIQDCYVPAVIPPILRHDYLNLIRSYQHKGIDTPFCEFIAERVYESHKEIARLLHVNAGL